MQVDNNYKIPDFPVVVKVVNREDIPLNDHLLATVFSYLDCAPPMAEEDSILQRSIQLAAKLGNECLKTSIEKYVKAFSNFVSNNNLIKKIVV